MTGVQTCALPIYRIWTSDSCIVLVVKGLLPLVTAVCRCLSALWYSATVSHAASFRRVNRRPPVPWRPRVWKWSVSRAGRDRVTGANGGGSAGHRVDAAFLLWEVCDASARQHAVPLRRRLGSFAVEGGVANRPSARVGHRGGLAAEIVTGAKPGDTVFRTRMTGCPMGRR